MELIHVKSKEAFDHFIQNGWVLEIERPAVLQVGEKPNVLVDGVQGWRNPRLISNAYLNRVSGIGDITIKEYAAEVSASSSFQLEVYVQNASNDAWNGDGEYPINLSYHWLDNEGNKVVLDGVRTKLCRSCISAGDFVIQTLTVDAPSDPGEYQLQVTAVQEGVQWLEDSGLKTHPVHISVA
ncbi:hypothetical protein ACFQDN_14635 [Pseudomonas asuensis]